MGTPILILTPGHSSGITTPLAFTANTPGPMKELNDELGEDRAFHRLPWRPNAWRLQIRMYLQAVWR